MEDITDAHLNVKKEFARRCIVRTLTSFLLGGVNFLPNLRKEGAWQGLSF